LPRCLRIELGKIARDEICAPPQRAAFKRLGTSELEGLPEAVKGPGTLHRVIAACQKTFLDAGLTAVEARAKYSKHGAKAK